MVMKFMQDTYSEFKQGVAEGRSLKLDEVETIARGRVWSGAQAKDRKLVDEFGGLHKAIDVARELAKVDPARKLRIQYFPEEKSLWQELAERAQPNGLHLHAALSPLRRLTRLREWVEVRLPFELEIR
jgi:protease-4